MTRKLDGKVAVVTGSGQGVGKGIAVGLAREGARVVTNDLKRTPVVTGADEKVDSAERERLRALKGDADSTARQIIEEGGEAVVFYGDVCYHEATAQLIQTAIDAYGRIDILVNNAAGLGSGALVETSEDDWDYQTIAKLKGSYNCMRHAIPHMIQQKFGRIINVASYAWMGLAGLAAYSAANAGVVGLTKATSKEVYRMGITVNAICPEAESPGHILEFAAMKNKLAKVGVEIPADKLKEISDAHGPAENLAPFVAYLATEEAAYISGAVFAVTGSGRVNYFTEPVMEKKAISKEGSPWTVEELIKVTPEQLLQGYRSSATVDDHSTMLDDL